MHAGVVPAIFLTSHGAIQFVTYEWLKQVSGAIVTPHREGVVHAVLCRNTCRVGCATRF